MKEERYLFDTKDNWLAQEKKRESHISVWDMDDRASKVKSEHEDHCEAEEVKEEHEFRHNQYNQIQQQAVVNKAMAAQRRGQRFVKAVFAFIFCVYLLIFLIFVFS